MLYGTAGLTVVLLITLGVSRLKPAAPGVERATVWIDTVKRGPMLREVRGLGTLVPEDIRWIPATTSGRVERILLRPGTVVSAGSVILELSNPQLEQELQDASLKLKGAEASLANLRVQLRNDALAQEAVTANIEADYKKAALQVEANEQLAKKGLVSDDDAEAGAGSTPISCRPGTRLPRSSWRATPSRCRRGSPCSSRKSTRRARSCT